MILMPNNKKTLPKLVSILLSCLVPGLGQVLQRKYRRGIYIFAAAATSLFTVLWYGNLAWLVIPVLIWVWNVWDATGLPDGHSVVLPVLLWLVMAFGIGTQVTNFSFDIFKNATRVTPILQKLVNIDFIEQNSEENLIEVNISSPCSENPAPPIKTENGLTLAISPDCATVNQKVSVHGSGFWPNYPYRVNWLTPIGNPVMEYDGTADANGEFSFEWVMLPLTTASIPDQTIVQNHSIQAIQQKKTPGFHISSNGGYVVKGIYETIALAFLSTIIGALLAVPLGFLAARNLMGGNPITGVIYFIVRTALNFLRSIEALIMAIIFVIIVGLGPFPGMIALTIHTAAALGKLYSEVIEGIDTGPIEAVKATGANWSQVVRFAVVPQVVPAFTSLTIYRWDINVRSSTIIGFVGGGGIGFYLWQWIVLQDFRAVGAAFVAIAVVVMILDFVSAKIREKLV
jgi:phosphonate transport system permease protein